MIVVYLDSSDYSVLSDPNRQTPQITALRESLIGFAKHDRVHFAFSGAHVSEMAPLDPAYTTSALARANLLVDLCGGNALVSFDGLIESEITRLLQRNPVPPQVMRSDGTWFPDLGDIMPRQIRLDDAITREVDELVSSSSANRATRRAVRKKALKGDRPRATLKRKLLNQDPKDGVAELVAKYPMRPEDAETLGQYVLGLASRAEADDAFRHSLRDPRWIMQWFSTHHDMLMPLIDWMRAPSRKMAANLRSIIPEAQESRRRAREMRQQLADLQGQGVKLPEDFQKNLRFADRWLPDGDSQLLRIAKRIAESQGLHFNDAISAADVDHYCPGLATAVRVMYASAADALNEQPRRPKDSDFLDLIHAMYAPYVSLFRADRYISSHLRKHVGSHTRIVASLRELPSAIQETLAAEADT